jgi:hypothetical protein
MPAPSASRIGTKKALGKTAPGRRGVPSWPDVLRVIRQDESAFQQIISRFRAAGGSADAWHLRETRQAMAGAITLMEDRLELEHPRQVELRAALRRVRRALEVADG